MQATKTPVADAIIRKKYSIPDDVDLDSVPSWRWPYLGFDKPKMKPAAKEIVGPPEIVPTLIKTPAYMMGERMIRGIASTAAINEHGYSLHPGGCFIQLPIPLLISHRREKCIGSVVGAAIDNNGITVWANIDSRCDDETWLRVQNGELKCFSGAMDNHQATFDPPVIIGGVKNFYRWRLDEVSLCERGANHESVVDCVWPSADEPGSSTRTDTTGGSCDGGSLESRIKALESRPEFKYCGVWRQDDDPHTPGDFCTHNGSLWACRSKTTEKPGTGDAWQLAVKKGRDRSGGVA